SEALGGKKTKKGAAGGGFGPLGFPGVRPEKPHHSAADSTITTSPLSFSARYKEGSAELVKIMPSAGAQEAFFYLGLTGAECTLRGQILVRGSLFGRFANKAGVQTATQPVEFSPSINSAAGGGLYATGEPQAGNLTAIENLKAGGTFFGVAPGGVGLAEALPTAAQWHVGH